MAQKTLWATLDEFLVHKGTGNPMPHKKWSNNTWVLMNYVDGSIAVRLHGTDVVRAEPNGNITLRTGGYHTVTTKARINEFLQLAQTGWKVFQKDYDWFITHYAGGGKWDVTEPFEEDMTLYALSEQPAPIIKEADPELEQLLAEEEAIQATEKVMLKIAAEAEQEKAMLNEVYNAKKFVHVKGVGVFTDNKIVEGDTEEWQEAVGHQTKCWNCAMPIQKDSTGVWVDETGGDGCSVAATMLTMTHISPWEHIMVLHNEKKKAENYYG